MTRNVHEEAQEWIALAGAQRRSDADEAWLQAHLRECAACRDYADEAASAVRALRSQPLAADSALVRATRTLAEGPRDGKRYLNFGASPRASLALFQAGRALAWLRGQDYLGPALVQELAGDVMRHRVGLTYEAEAENFS